MRGLTTMLIVNIVLVSIIALMGLTLAAQKLELTAQRKHLDFVRQQNRKLIKNRDDWKAYAHRTSLVDVPTDSPSYNGHVKQALSLVGAPATPARSHKAHPITIVRGEN